MIRDFLIIDFQTKERFHKSFSKEPTPEALMKKFLLRYSNEFESNGDVLHPIKNIPLKQFLFTFLVRDGLIFIIISEIHDSKKDMEVLLTKVTNSLSGFSFQSPLSSTQREELERRITKDLFSQIKIALIGKDNVGKSAIFNKLEGDISYSHSKRVMRSKRILMDTSDLEVYLLDYIGTEEYSPQWPNLLRGVHIILIVVDSTVENVLSTKRLFLNLIRTAKPDAKILGIANKQDQPNVLDASLIQKMLDIEEVFPLSMHRLTEIKTLENIFLHAIEKYLTQFLVDTSS